MHAAAKPTEEQPQATGLTRPTWLVLSYVLAMFTLLTVVTNLFFTHHLVQRYRRTVAVNEEWSQRLEQYAELEQLAALANTPIHAVFASYDADTEAARMHLFLRLFHTALAELQEEMRRNLSEAWAVSVLEDLIMIGDTITTMGAEADLLYEALRRNQPLMAQQRLAQINHLYTDTTTAFEALREHVRVVQRTLFNHQTTVATALETYEYGIAACLFLLVLGVLVYGRTLAGRMAREVLEKERYHADLRDAEARTRAIIDTAVDGIITIDARGLIETFNPAAERIFGHTSDQVIGQNVSMLMPFPYRGEHDDAIARSLQTEQPTIIGISRELEGQRRDGTVFPIDVTVSALQLGQEQLFTGIVRDITERKRAEEMRKVRDQLAKFVPEAAKRLIAANPDAPELDKQERDVSVLFLDISGYARLSERLPAEVLNMLIERYFSTFLDCIQEAGGDINETAGDGFMAIFQDPDRQRHAVTAVEVALAVLGATHTLNADNREQPLDVHMGLNSGLALVGSTRFEGLRGTRWTFTASGTVTNLAARLAGIAQPGQILVGPETAQRLGGRYPVRRLSREHLKNLSEAIDVYCILSASSHSPAHRDRWSD